MDRPEISVVTLTWNSERDVEALLTTLLDDAHENAIKIEVFMVDNGSTDHTVELIQEYAERHDEITLLQMPKNLGTTVPRNIAIRQSTGDNVLILDGDTEIPRGTLRGLLSSLERIPDPDTIGIVCPRLLNSDGTFQESARRFPTFFTKLYRLLGMEKRRIADETVDAVVRGELTPIDCAMSAAWFVPRHTFDRVGHLDERIFYAPEDVEFCARVWTNGLKVWYDPAVQVVHKWQRITNKKPISMLGFSHMKGLIRYWWEYNSFFTRPTFRAKAGPTR